MPAWQTLRRDEGRPHPEAGRPRVQPLCAVDLQVEERVEEVEARHPQRDRGAEGPRLPRQLARDRHPGADRRQAVDRAQPEVAEPGRPLQVRVDHEGRDRDRPEPAHDGVELPDGDQEDHERQDAERDHLPGPQAPARELPCRGPWVPRVDAGVHQPVQRHGQRAGAHHRDRDPDEIVGARDGVHCEEGADVRERQREDRVLDLDERGETCGEGGQRLGHVCLWAVCSSARRANPCARAGRMTS